LKTPGSFDLLHYAGHGEAPSGGTIDASLILAVRSDGAQWVTEELDSTTVAQLANLASNGTRPMVVLNACQVGRMQRRLGGTGGFAKAFLNRGAGVFVSSLWAVGDEPARDFVEGMYDSLSSGDMIFQAVNKAREAARKAGDFTWLAYTVYANPHATISFG
jgi:CHAT domain-containing protein